MPELRRDYLLDKWVIIAPERKKRPHDFKISKPKLKKGSCPFCIGNEHMTPPETFRIEKAGKWLVRAFPNMYPAVAKGSEALMLDKEFFYSKKAVGAHEILVETPNNEKQFYDLSVEEIEHVLQGYVQRTASLGALKNVRYVLAFKNHGAKAGASLMHSHSQIIAYNKVPGIIDEKVKASGNYRRKKKACPYCRIIAKERKSKRFIAENNGFIAFAPFASIQPLEAWVFPKKHLRSIVEVDELRQLALILKKLLLKLKKLNAAYNFYVHNAPSGKDLHFHIELRPQLSKPAGFEYGTGTYINVISPEDAAIFYKK